MRRLWIVVIVLSAMLSLSAVEEVIPKTENKIGNISIHTLLALEVSVDAGWIKYKDSKTTEHLYNIHYNTMELFDTWVSV